MKVRISIQISEFFQFSLNSKYLLTVEVCNIDHSSAPTLGHKFIHAIFYILYFHLYLLMSGCGPSVPDLLLIPCISNYLK